MRKSKMLIAGLLIASNVCYVSASAQEVGGVSTEEVNVNVPSEFEVAPSDLSELSVSIPARLDLTQKSEFSEAFVGSGEVSAKGRLASNRMLSVSVSPIVEYKNSENQIETLEADVTFSKNNVQGFHFWTPDELEASNTTLDSRPISLEVKRTQYKGTFEGNIKFRIKCDKVVCGDDYSGRPLSYNSDNSNYSLSTTNTDRSFIDIDEEGKVTLPTFGVINGKTVGEICNFSDTSAWTQVTELNVPPSYTGISISDYKVMDKLNLSDNLQSLNISNAISLDMTQVKLPKALKSLGVTKDTSIKCIGYPGEDGNLALSDGMKSVGFENCKIEKAILKNMVGSIYVNTPGIRFNNCDNLNYLKLEKGIGNVYVDIVMNSNSNFIDTLDCSGINYFIQNDYNGRVTKCNKLYLSRAFVGVKSDASQPVTLSYNIFPIAKDVYYDGTMAQFKGVDHYDKISAKLAGQSTIHCSDGDIVL